MPARDQILNNIRRNLGGQLADKQTVLTAYKQLNKHALRKPASNIIDAFQTELEALVGQVTRVSQTQDVASIVLKILESHDSKNLLITNSELCAQIKWPDDIKIESRKAEDKDKVSLSSAYAGIAETGSVVMCSSPQTPTTHNFLVEDHVVLLPASRLFTHLEVLWDEMDLNSMPRAINILTGPSRTADVEQTLQIGAHGPLRFHVILLLNE